MRIGYGFDAHRLIKNRDLILGGVTIPHEKGLLGHSDADVLVHAIIDAMLGASCLGDIGTHFPPTDNTYLGARSIILLRDTAQILLKKGYTVINIDSTIIAQRPKLKEYIPKMQIEIAKTLNIDADCVSIKATTTEHMGYEGNEEGISAHAVCLIKK